MPLPWPPKDYCPTELRTVAKVLLDARPAAVGSTYRWWCGGSDWWGVEPHEGVLPAEIVSRMAKRDRFTSEADAMAELTRACEGLELDAWGRVKADEPTTAKGG